MSARPGHDCCGPECLVCRARAGALTPGARHASYRCTCGWVSLRADEGTCLACPQCGGIAVRIVRAPTSLGDYVPPTVDEDGELVDPPAPVAPATLEDAFERVDTIECGLNALEERVDELDGEMTRQLRELAERVLELERKARLS